MSNLIKRTHFLMLRKEFTNKASNKYAVIDEVATVTPQKIIERVERIPYNWINKKIYDHDILEQRIADQKIRLFDLKVTGPLKTKNVGYHIAAIPDINIQLAFLNEVMNLKPVETENVALYNSERGNGLGGEFLHKIQSGLFQDGHQVHYLNTSSTNDDGLPKWYKRMGMTNLGQDEVEDFNDRLPNNGQPYPWELPQHAMNG